MDYFYQLIAKERQSDISKELATRHMLDEAESNAPGIKRVKRMGLRFAPAMIIMTLILLYFLG